jgi:hypothetical protein
MLRTLLPASTILGAILLPLAGHAAQLDELKSPNLELPSSDKTFPDGPGADAMNGNCLACHSADHTLNQPTLPRKVWEEIVDKMIALEPHSIRNRHRVLRHHRRQWPLRVLRKRRGDWSRRRTAVD